jgi:hypothetical protein
MNLTRIAFLGLALTLPTTWTLAQAGEEAPPAGEKTTTKKTKKTKKGSDGSKTETEKSETKTE